MAVYNSRLGDLLVERRLITGKQLEEAVCLQQRSHLKLGEILVAKKFLSTRQLKRTLRIQVELRKTILTTFLCLVPIQYSDASEQREHLDFSGHHISSTYQENLNPKASLSFNTFMQGVDFLFSSKESKQLNKANIADEELTPKFDFSFGKDNFNIKMRLTF